MLSSPIMSSGLNEVVFLGHIVSGNGISIDPKKVESIVSWECPKNVTKI